MDFTIRQEAIKDMDSIWDYTKEQWSREQANRYYKLLYTEIYRLTHYPLSGKDCNELGEGYRYSKIKSHFIFYIITPTETIDVLRVLHENMNFLQQFNVSKTE